MFWGRYEYMFLLQNLEKLGLLRKRESMFYDTASPFTTIRKQLALIQADVDTSCPDDISYVSSGYAPISTRLIQTCIKGWTGKEEALKELPGRGIDILQRFPPEEFSQALKQSSGPSLDSLAKEWNKSRDSKEKPVLLVYFVGGVTYAEIAAMRFLSKAVSFPYNIMCCTTSVINGNTFIKSLI